MATDELLKFSILSHGVQKMFTLTRLKVYCAVMATVLSGTPVAVGDWTFDEPVDQGQLPEGSTIYANGNGPASVDFELVDSAFDYGDGTWFEDYRRTLTSSAAGQWEVTDFGMPVAGTWFRSVGVQLHKHHLKAFGGGIPSNTREWLAYAGT